MTDTLLIDTILKLTPIETKSPELPKLLRKTKMTSEETKEKDRKRKKEYYDKNKEFTLIITEFLEQLSTEKLIPTVKGQMKIKNNNYHIQYKIQCKRLKQPKK